MKAILAFLVLAALAAGGYFLFFTGNGEHDPGPGTESTPTVRAPDVTEKPAELPDRPKGDPEDDASRRAADVAERAAAPKESYPQGIEGTVLSSAGSGIAGAEIYLLHGLAPNDMIQQLAMHGGRLPLARVAAQGATTAGGAFRLESPVTEGQANFELRAKAPGHVTYQQSLRITAGRWERLPPIKLEAGRSLQGTVRDKTTKAAIGGATVRAKLPGSFQLPVPGQEEGIEVTCDANGRYALGGLAKGPFELVAFARGFGRTSRPDVTFTDAEQTRTEDLELDKGFEIEGWVADADNVPVARAEVTALPFSQNAQPVTAFSDKDGRFSLLGLGEGQYTVSAKATGYVKNERKPIKAGDKDVAVVLEKQGSVKVRVVAKSSRPLASYHLEVKRYFEGQEQFGRCPEIEPVQVRGAKNGEYEMGGIDPGQYVLQVDADGFARTYSKNFAIVEGEHRSPTVEVVMNEGATIFGTVTDAAGQPIRGASVFTLEDSHIDNPLMEIFGALMPVRITKTSAVTDASGKFELKKLTPCKYQLKFEHPEYSRTFRKGFDVADGDKLDTGPTRLQQGGQLSGKVFGPTGQPVAAAKVTLSMTGGEGVGSVFETAFTDATGSFKFDRRLPPGKYDVTAQRTDQQNVLMGIVDIQQSRKELNIVAGPQTVTVHIKPQ